MKMNAYETVTSLIDYTISSDNRRHMISSIEIGLGFLLLALGVGTATCKLSNKEDNDE